MCGHGCVASGFRRCPDATTASDRPRSPNPSTTCGSYVPVAELSKPPPTVDALFMAEKTHAEGTRTGSRLMCAPVVPARRRRKQAAACAGVPTHHRRRARQLCRRGGVASKHLRSAGAPTQRRAVSDWRQRHTIHDTPANIIQAKSYVSVAELPPPPLMVE